MSSKYIYIREPAFSRIVFSSTKLSWFWFIVRVYVGWEWLLAGLAKISSPAWTGPSAGSAISGFIKGALTKTAGEHPDVSGWYAFFLKNYVANHPAIWSYAVAWGELLVGVALIIGALVGIAAFFGLFMNLNYLLAGTVSTNPVLFSLGILLVLAWKVAGYWGVDRFLLSKLGTPWSPGEVFRK